MTWVWPAFGGGESRDKLIEGYSAAGATPVIGTAECSVISSPVKTGNGAIQIAAETDPYTSILLVNSDSQLKVIQAYLNFNGAPGNGCLGPYVPRTLGTSNCIVLEVDSGCRVRLVKLGPLEATNWSNRVPLSPWSSAMLGNGAWTHLAWFIDPLTMGTSHEWHVIMIDGAVQIAGDFGPCTWGTGNLRLVNYTDVALRVDDLCVGYSTSASDAPHLAQVPLGLVGASHPNANGSNSEWGMFPNGGESRYQDWDDATGNDGDSSYLYTATKNQDQDSDFESADNLAWGAGAVILENGAGKAPIHSIIHKQTTGTKWAGKTLCSLASDVTLEVPTSSYVGSVKQLTRTGGGSWARADLGNLTCGCKTTADNHDYTWRVTTLMLQWLYSQQNLPLTPRPREGRRMVYPLRPPQVI